MDAVGLEGPRGVGARGRLLSPCLRASGASEVNPLRACCRASLQFPFDFPPSLHPCPQSRKGSVGSAGFDGPQGQEGIGRGVPRELGERGGGAPGLGRGPRGWAGVLLRRPEIRGGSAGREGAPGAAGEPDRAPSPRPGKPALLRAALARTRAPSSPRAPALLRPASPFLRPVGGWRLGFEELARGCRARGVRLPVPSPRVRAAGPPPPPLELDAGVPP